MQSYDIGCSYSGGADPGSVLTEAGLSFVTHSQSEWKASKRCYLFWRSHQRTLMPSRCADGASEVFQSFLINSLVVTSSALDTLP